MRRAWRGLKTELVPTLSLAWPVIAAELGWMGMGVVDTIVVGRLGAEAIGAVSLGSAVYFAASIFGMGLLLGLDTLVSQAYGAGKLGECRGWLIQGLYLALFATPPVMGLLWWGVPRLAGLGIHPSVLEATVPFLKALTWGTLPLFIYSALRRYLQARGVVKPVMYTLLAANLFNAFADWVLVYGKLGAPAMGVEGAGWATTMSRMFLASGLAMTVLIHDRGRKADVAGVSRRPSPALLARLLALGLPAAVHVTLEVGVFAAATTLAGMLDPVSLAAHHVVLDIASVTFMIPLGLSSAGAVRVGQALGRREPDAAQYAGWTALMLGAAFMTFAAVVFVAAPGGLIAIFTDDPAVVGTAASLMLIAAAFQLFDGLQGVSAGTMRGAGDTRTPVVCTVVAYWIIGLPLGYVLAFRGGLGIAGLWIGLAAGLAVAGLSLLGAWALKARALARGEYQLADAPLPVH
jgi:MATE family multidrug resistance protein